MTKKEFKDFIDRREEETKKDFVETSMKTFNNSNTQYLRGKYNAYNMAKKVFNYDKNKILEWCEYNTKMWNWSTDKFIQGDVQGFKEIKEKLEER